METASDVGLEQQIVKFDSGCDDGYEVPQRGVLLLLQSGGRSDVCKRFGLQSAEGRCQDVV